MHHGPPAPPAATPLPNAERLLQHQSQCWRDGECLPVEIFLQNYPSLHTDRELVLDLICHEILLRTQQGDAPSPEEYLRRFPDFREELRVQFEVQRVMAAHAAVPATITGVALREAASTAPAEVAGYVILEELGRGGMGVVYLARHRDLKRLVALKMIQSSAQGCPRTLARFRAESEVLARLQHPNIVQIYEVGEWEGRPFFAQEYLPGGGLDRRLKGRPQPPRTSAQMMEALSRGVHAAHEAGVIHRDLKPANVLLASDDTPKLTDFGLAKQLDSNAGQTQTGDILGTPHYMAPELANGRLDAVGPATDVWSLGAIFYECLTGRPPFNGATAWDTMEQVLAVDPVPPTLLQAKVPRDLEVICLKCLAKEPAHRYPRALDLADDLQRFLFGEPIRARPAPVVVRAALWVRRYPAVATLWATGALCTLALLLAAILWLRAYVSDARADVSKAQKDLIVVAQREAAARNATTIDQGLRSVDVEIEKKDWAKAKTFLDWTTRQLDAAEITYQTNPAFFALRGRTEDLRLKIANKVNSFQQLTQFRALRAEAAFLVVGLAGTDTAQLESRWRIAQDVVRRALILFGANPDTRADPNLANPNLSTAEKKEVTEGCCEMLLGLAQLVAELAPAELGGGEGERALTLLEQANRLCPSMGCIHSRRARCLHRLGRDLEAKDEEKLAQARSFTEGFEWFLRGTDLYLDGDLAGAVKAFELAIVQDPNQAAAHYASAAAQLRMRQQTSQAPQARGLLLAANMSLSVCIKLESGVPWPFLARGFTRHELGMADEAESDFREAEKLLAGDYTAAKYALLVTRGTLRIGAGKLPGAINDLTEAVKIKPRDYQAHVNLHRAYLLQGQKEEALREMDQAIAMGVAQPASVQAVLHRTRASLHQQAGRTSAAVEDLDKAAGLELAAKAPAKAAEDLLSKGRLLAQTQDYAGAVLAYGAALAAQPDHLGALRSRAEALLRLQRADEALRDLNALLEGERGRQPGVGPLYRARAGIRAQTGAHQGAIEDYTNALAAEPRTGPAALAAHNGRGWSYLAMEAALLAQADFDSALRLAPKDGDAHNGLAHALLKLGRFTDAADSAEQALRQGPAERTPTKLCWHTLQAARVFSQLSLKAAEEAGLNTERGKGISLANQNRALALLRDAVMALPSGERSAFWSTTVESDRAWKPIRECAGFQQLAAEMHKD